MLRRAQSRRRKTLPCQVERLVTCRQQSSVATRKRPRPNFSKTVSKESINRAESGGSLAELFGKLHEQVSCSKDGPLNAHLLSFLGSQAIAASCRRALDWASISGRRVCRRIEDSRGPPCALLERVATAFVDIIHLCREGCRTCQEQTEVIAACRRARTLLCTYGDVTGLAHQLDWGGSVLPCLNLRAVRFRQSRLAADDACQLLRCCPRLETAVFHSENLEGLAEACVATAVLCRDLRSLYFTDCFLSAMDAAGALGLSLVLEHAHFQSMDLRGLRVSLLSSLTSLSLLDCQLSRADAVGLMACCPGLVRLELCGNPLGSTSRDYVWPRMSELRHADFRLCELSVEDEDALRASMPAGATLRCRSTLLSGDDVGLSSNSNHVLFESSDSEC